MTDSHPVNSPVVPGTKLTKQGGGMEVDATHYKQMVGSLMYLTATRPDLMFSVCLVSRFMENPTELHLQVVKRIMRYVKGTTDLGILYSSKGDGKMIAFSDSDYAGDLDDRRSTSGYVFLLGTGSVAWISKKQAVVSLSTTEAEFISAALCACQCIWLRRILVTLGFSQSGCSTIYCDNSSAIKLSKNPVFHGRSKHIDVRYHFLRDLVRDGKIELIHCGTEEQVSDIMTKPLKVEAFVKFRKELGMCSASAVN
ncbi:secreted RxLR effector protein 161-like [Lotus japonicus]|uniref:secreted RxLR effector protein 161-like n=1 Tax=Lotus japonicus TaxID=34305 RepID=UPI0025897B5D|nr:secreted RxLR effector protein 161-like [Lotus japonicus]